MLIKIIFAIVVGATLVGLVWYFVVYSPNLVTAPVGNTINTSFPVITDEQVNDRQAGTILTTNNSVVISDEVIVNNPAAVVIDSGFYELTNNSALFGIYYFADGGNLTVNLYSEDTKRARLAAEKYLLSDLKFTEKQLCSMAANVLTNEYENPDLAGMSLGFSFCSAAVQL